ncbi:MAG TPA: trypsin-like peptidase domain-containing protein [Solirubrobacteraceae bacterium]|nr:trypsin-like peptidase domain-containing protein [Solirubrobacteraceae bacterium]
MNASKFLAALTTVVLAAIGGAAVFPFAAAPRTASPAAAPAPRVPVSDLAQPAVPTPSAAAAEAADPKAVYEGAKASVAEIRAQTAQGESTGTGFVVSSDGLLVTNAHVVDGAGDITVKLGTDGTTLPAQLLGGDPSQDLAVLQVDPGPGGLTALRLASDPVEVGDPVYAIGSPFGLSQTFTSGIVSAVGRDIQAPDGSAITDVLQTDAAINPGNSGGPLLDASGAVVGVNSQIASRGGGNDGIGFAIPATTVQALLAQATAGASNAADGQSASGIES